MCKYTRVHRTQLSHVDGFAGMDDPAYVAGLVVFFLLIAIAVVAGVVVVKCYKLRERRKRCVGLE